MADWVKFDTPTDEDPNLRYIIECPEKDGDEPKVTVVDLRDIPVGSPEYWRWRFHDHDKPIGPDGRMRILDYEALAHVKDWNPLGCIYTFDSEPQRFSNEYPEFGIATSSDFRRIKYRGKEFDTPLNDRAAKVFKLILEHSKGSVPGISNKDVMGEIDGRRPRDVFRIKGLILHPAWKLLKKNKRGKNTFYTIENNQGE